MSLIRLSKCANILFSQKDDLVRDVDFFSQFRTPPSDDDATQLCDEANRLPHLCSKSTEYVCIQTKLIASRLTTVI